MACGDELPAWVWAALPWAAGFAYVVVGAAVAACVHRDVFRGRAADIDDLTPVLYWPFAAPVVAALWPSVVLYKWLKTVWPE